MAGIEGRKNLKISKKCELDVETFACDILSYILPLCGYPEEKIKGKERKKNAYDDNNYVFRVGAIVLNVALTMRDEWKIMFESRLKSSGFDTTEKIEKYLKSFLAISQEFRKGNTSTKIYVSLAAYSEIMLFLDYKGIEFDFEQLLNLWNLHFKEHIRQHQNSGELLKNLFFFLSDPSEFIEWITAFLQDVATPYGYRDDVSKNFLLHADILKKIDDQKNFQLAEMLAHLIPQTTTASEEPLPVLPPGFESAAVLPGDRESPEPPESSESSFRRGEKESKRRSAQSTSVWKCASEGRPRRKTSSELGIEDRLGQMSLDSEKSPPENKRKRRKPKGRKSY